jgi:hypothetical protein
MGRWDERNALDVYKRDDWNHAFNNDFDWKETPLNKHPKKCNCPKHEYLAEKINTPREFPIVYKYCPDHFKEWHNSKNQMLKQLNWLQRQIVKFMFWRKMIIVKELTYAQSDICIWCRLGGGGRGIKTPYNTISPHQ